MTKFVYATCLKPHARLYRSHAVEHFRINLDIVWQTVREDLPKLIALLEPLVPPEEE